MEDISGQLYLNQYKVKSEASDTRAEGEPQPLKRKLLTGGLLVVLLIFVLWFPLLIMSLVNDRAQANVPDQVQVSLSINSYQPLFVMDTFATNVSITPADYKQLKSADKSGLIETYKQDDIQRTLLSPLSKSLWDISPSSRVRLLEVLRDPSQTVQLTFSWAFTRQARAGVAITADGNLAYVPKNATALRESLYQALQGNGQVHLPRLFPSIYQLSKLDAATFGARLPPSLGMLYGDAVLTRLEDPDDPKREYWSLRQVSPHVVRNERQAAWQENTKGIYKRSEHTTIGMRDNT